MCNIYDMPREWAEDDKRSEADAFADALKRIKPTSELEHLQQENKQLREDNQKLREALMRTTTDSYEFE